MTESANVKVAMSLLKEVEGKVKEILGDQIALPYDPDGYNAELDVFCGDMVKQCEIAEKKAPESQDVLVFSNILKAQLYGCWHKPTGQRGTHNKAVEAYEKALELGGDEAELRYDMALLYRAHHNKKKVIENFQRVIELVGVDNELGIECAKELEKEKAKKGCFIATAVYGTEFAPDVMVLKQYRDDIFLKSSVSRAFVQAYYFISPPVARVIEMSGILRKLTRNILVRPLAKVCRCRGSYTDGNS